MDSKDKRLLYFLDLKSRIKDTELAKELKTSKHVVNYRIKRLIEDGVIKQFQTVLNLEKLGINLYASIYFKLRETDKNKEKKILDYLVNNKKVSYVGLIGGRYDLSIVLASHNIKELDKKLNQIVEEYPGELGEYEVSLRTFGAKFPKKFLLETKDTESKKILSEIGGVEQIDSLDRKILKILSINSRESLVKISEKLKIPFSTVRKRIKSLETSGVIAGYSLLFDLKKIGIMNYKIFIRTKNKSETTTKNLMEFCARHKNITWFFKTIGQHDYEIRVEVENPEIYQEIIREIRSAFGNNIEELETVNIFNELKEDYSTILEDLSSNQNRTKDSI